MIIGSVLYTNILYYSGLGSTIVPIFIVLILFLLSLYIKLQLEAGKTLIFQEKYFALCNTILFVFGSGVVAFNFWIGIDFEKVMYPAADMYQKEEEEEILMHTQLIISRKTPTIDQCLALKPSSIKLEELPPVTLEDVRFAEEHFGIKESL